MAPPAATLSPAQPRSQCGVLDRSHGFIAPRPLYTGPLCPTFE
jgi:hypothetical protein